MAGGAVGGGGARGRGGCRTGAGVSRGAGRYGDGGGAVRRRAAGCGGAAAAGQCGRDGGKGAAQRPAGGHRPELVAGPLSRHHRLRVLSGNAHQLSDRLRWQQRILPASRSERQLQRVRHHLSGRPGAAGFQRTVQYAVRPPHEGPHHVRVHRRLQGAVVLRRAPVSLRLHQRGDVSGGSVRGPHRARRARGIQHIVPDCGSGAVHQPVHVLRGTGHPHGTHRGAVYLLLRGGQLPVCGAGRNDADSGRIWSK